MLRPLSIVAALLATCVGWWTFWFLCDDAYIAFRYVSNSQLGHGYTWNAAPFEPVEGYSSFLWVVLLDWVWTLTGIEPPESANPLGLFFGLVQIGLVVGIVDSVRLTVLDSRRDLVLAFVLLATVTNRTFLAWTSSGLETSMFDACVLAWILAGLRQDVRVVALCASLLELARPDGLLYCIATVPYALVRGRPRDLWPLGIAAIHEVWRIWTYGAPLPNTYYAKVASWWPEMGLLYLAGFLLEYGFWLLIPLAFAALRHLWRHPPDLLWPPTLTGALVVVTPLAHLAYYTLRVGGDHFGFRIYAWTVPLVWIGAFVVLDRIAVAPRKAFGGLALVFALGLPLPWTLWYHTHHIEERFQGGMPSHEVAPHLPWLYPLAWVYDRQQEAAIGSWVGMRFQTHKIYWLRQKKRYPSRDEGSRIPADGIPVYAIGAVGYPGWVFPNVAIIDVYGLNDPIIARNPAPRKGGRRMAHERVPPEGYQRCFRPNVQAGGDDGTFRVKDRVLTPEDVVRCQQEGWAALP